ncbi:PREDICTED: voltage-dependent calcium channel subunit alpha-2/delta-1-like [Nanorana parkeri]|uniref:voltage-dependent calcium channel subunit alpha-2/delta-1-like n=1 Tax=Nanorana parkeri TaxID=125878 RepID=UPI0008541FEA|nr:PREDICTED: voltage-dependent calcium channel subunit alpha-2/delta-1-like [Nanorana parkeri]
MAASWFLVFTLTLFQSMLICRSSEEYFPTAATIKQWVDKMQYDLVTLARTASGVDQLADIYLKNRNLYTVEANNARQLVESAATNIEKLLRNRSKALVNGHLLSASEVCERISMLEDASSDSCLE